METILYLMHINWNWIKQRPQFIAEGLSEKYEVCILYKHLYKTNGYQKTKTNLKNIKLREVYGLPNRLNKYTTFNSINIWLFRRKVKKIIAKKAPKCIYITGPSLFRAIPKQYKGKVIYDCMDDHLALHKDPNDYEVRDERQLVKRANNIVITSNHLEQVILKRYGTENQKKISVVRNGFSGKILNNINKGVSNNKIVYFGTVSHWLDFSMLEKSLDDFQNIEYDLYGPIDDTLQLPNNPRIHFLGTVEHNELPKIAQNSLALMMPFKVNDIIKSVDPVKLYEYINFDKNIICVKYPEILRFNDFVYFYNNYSEYKKIISKILENNCIKYSEKQRINFLKNNRWNNRVNDIFKIIENH